MIIFVVHAPHCPLLSLPFCTTTTATAAGAATITATNYLLSYCMILIALDACSLVIWFTFLLTL